MPFIVTLEDAGLCYITRVGGDNYCQYRLSTQPKKKEFFATRKQAKRALKEMYEFREGRRLTIPSEQLNWWKIVEVDETGE